MNPRPHTRLALLTAILVFATSLTAQLGPEVTSWRTNLNGVRGSSIDPGIHATVSRIEADVQRVQYDASDVYVTVTAVPSHNVGPFGRNPNVPNNLNRPFRITRRPQKATTNTATGLGPIGVFVNGVPAYNALDGRSYFNQGVWNQNAYLSENRTFDAASGHPSRSSYHYHIAPRGVLEQEAESWGKEHSPLIGFSFDGYPVYGPYGFVNPNGSGGIQRIRTGYRLRNITVRQVLPNGNRLQPSQYGPVVSKAYPLGYYVEDYEYVRNLGDLDEFNGRFTVTPEYPNGTYAYFATIDDKGVPAYPYLIGPDYYGVSVNNRNVRIPGGVTTYVEQVQHTGRGCAGLFLDASGLPKVPNSAFAVTLTKGQANAQALFLVGSGLLPVTLQLFGCPVYLDIQSPFTTVGLLQLNASGAYSLKLPIPNDAALVGLSVDLQAAASITSGTTTSNALTLLLQR